ncbi:MAG TPA: hypothetical protein VNQ53_15180 [Nocardioides sp.]|nr:hypothetical protein [Nocardioides sp.]
MWIPWQWASASNERAIANARLGTTECSRLRLERAEVELFLAALYPEPAPSSHPA